MDQGQRPAEAQTEMAQLQQIRSTAFQGSRFGLQRGLKGRSFRVREPRAIMVQGVRHTFYFQGFGFWLWGVFELLGFG